MALEGANDCLHVDTRHSFSLENCFANLLEFKEIDFWESSKEHSRDVVIDIAIFAILLSLKKQVHVLICDNLGPANTDFFILSLIFWRRHYEACVDHVVRILQLINILDRMNLFHRVEIKYHSVVTFGDLQ